MSNDFWVALLTIFAVLTFVAMMRWRTVAWSGLITIAVLAAVIAYGMTYFEVIR